jgi:hypothetical protein
MAAARAREESSLKSRILVGFAIVWVGPPSSRRLAIPTCCNVQLTSPTPDLQSYFKNVLIVL